MSHNVLGLGAGVFGALGKILGSPNLAVPKTRRRTVRGLPRLTPDFAVIFHMGYL